MNNCLNCNAPIKQPEGRRPRKFCDNKGKCKGEYHRKLNKKIKEVVPKEKYDELLKELKELKFAKSVPEKKGHQYPLEEKDMVSEKQLIEIAQNATAGVTPSEEFKKEVYKANIPDATTRARIKQLEYELAHAPKTFSVSGMKDYYFNSRQTELKKLKNQ